MKLQNKNDFLKSSMETLGQIFDLLAHLPKVKLKDLRGEETALVIIDMVNGFAREGALKSSRIEELIPEITWLSKMCDIAMMPKLAFADTHTNESPEFAAYPAHCLKGTAEAEIVEEIKQIGGYTLISKNSTNGFLEDEFQQWLQNHSNINNFIITGDCTDICIQQFAITLKTWFNKYNRPVRVIVPINAVETYDLGMHNGDLMNVMALYKMITNGVEVVQAIEDSSKIA